MKISLMKNFSMKAILLFIILFGIQMRAISGREQEAGNNRPIQCDESGMVFLIKTENSSYAFGMDKTGLFVNLHWGGKITDINDIPAPPATGRRFQENPYEYSANAEGVRMEPCLKIEKPDQLVHLRQTFDSYKIQDNHLQVTLKAKDYPFYTVLHYQVYPGLDLIDRWVEVKNEGKEEVDIENIQSASWYVPHSHRYRLTHMYGSWGKEWQINREFVGPGEKVLESRNGISGHYHVPYFALDRDGLANEKEGVVWFGTLQWSGDWKMIIELDAYNRIRVSGGYNNFDFLLKLAPGQSHKTPVFTAGFTRGGFGEASRMIHRYQRRYLYPENMLNVEVPIVYNSFGALLRLGVNEKNVMSLIPRAAEVGAEVFIIDDGWQTAIGEWTVDKQKFPRGLKSVIDEVHRQGMKFGIWMEPERVMDDSKLFSDKDKQEWLFAKTEWERWGGKDMSSTMINLSRPDVLEYVYQEMSKLLRENEIDYLKLDFNRYFEVPDIADHRTMRTRYTENFYKLFERLEKEFPDVFFENCASGNGRPDLKMDDYFARINRSDNQDPVDCIVLQEGFTYLHPAYMAGGAGHLSYTSTSYNGRHAYAPLDFMAHVGMMGWLATTLQLDKMTPEELSEVKGYFNLFKKIRHITCKGELHRIASLREHPYAAFQFVLPDAGESLLFAFGHGLQFMESIPNMLLESLNPDKTYEIAMYGKNKSVEDIDKPVPMGKITGRALMEIGIPVNLKGDYDSRIFHIKVIE